MSYKILFSPVKKMLLILTGFLLVGSMSAQSNDDCMMCHSDPTLSATINGKNVSLYITGKTLARSVHKGLKCIACHTDANVTDFPHPVLKPVQCGQCHKTEMVNYDRGVHGQAQKEGALYAPTCKECHGTHNVFPSTDPASKTFKMNIPYLCGKCHREGAPVARVYNIDEHNILQNYSQSIHGNGLFKQGLIVTATCNNCHGNHLILPHTSPNSTIAPDNIAKTCMQCHARIEQVHVKIIKGKLWEEKPGVIPACTDCHLPHKVNVENVVTTISDRSCLKCHAKKDVHKTVGDSTVSMYVTKGMLNNSVHKNIPCVKCHTDVTPHAERPCITAKRVDCSNCHAEISNQYFASGHGQAYMKKDKEAPYCTTCHGAHQIKSRFDDTSPDYRANIPKLCGDCHSKNGKANVGTKLHEVTALYDYSKSVHGEALKNKGLIISAVCTDCHTSHLILGPDNPESSIYPRNIPSTCGTCHKGIYNKYVTSDHAITKNDRTHTYPTCVTCHSAHKISNVKQDRFMDEVTGQCGSCHKQLAKSYLETYHGKAHELGNMKTAKCSDCHGAHHILNVNNPNSSVSPKNIVTTCKKCHPDANKRFTGYLTHATHHDKNKYAILYYTFWAMTFLLVGVFGFFGLHLLLWLPRSLMGLKEKKAKEKKASPEANKYYIRRFTKAQRFTHLFVILSFLMLALTGMILKFADMPWADFISHFLGGVTGAGIIHRFAAVITFGYFSFHLYTLIRQKIKNHISVKQLIFGKNSLMFNKQDVIDFWNTLKWFVGLGPRPNYGRWTYWEKFDYFAVFWGVTVIGLSGLIQWFPTFFTTIFPGWLINVAQIIHSDEALLAVGFIFTIHFFNTHLRPEAFPMDTVIFTGTVPYEDYKRERPREVEELKQSGKLKKVLIKKEKQSKWMPWIKGFGYFFLAFGLTLVVLIIYSMLFGYK
ncbi:MAG: hypothetical protein IH595_14420 [Bacteroidales bacterium]|nr:hypothetical protein [Bacteroidales bacterium]